MVTPVPYVEVVEQLASLELGLDGEKIHFSWRPYAQRAADHRADYDRLIVSIFHEGIQRPLITWGHHVLIGMRRAEIGKRLGIETVRCWRITEDVRMWTGKDIPRLNALKAQVGATAY